MYWYCILKKHHDIYSPVFPLGGKIINHKSSNPKKKNDSLIFNIFQEMLKNMKNTTPPPPRSAGSLSLVFPRSLWVEEGVAKHSPLPKSPDLNLWRERERATDVPDTWDAARNSLGSGFGRCEWMRSPLSLNFDVKIPFVLFEDNIWSF